MPRKFVIDKTTKQVKRHGFSDFANDGTFDSGTEEIIEKSASLVPGIHAQNWYWNASTQEFQITAP